MTTKKESTFNKAKQMCSCCKCGSVKAVATIAISAVIGGVAAIGLCHAFCGTKTVIVNFEQVQKEAKAYQAILSEQHQYEEKLQAQMNLEFGELQKEDAILSAQKSSLKEAEYQKKVIALQKKAAELQQKYQIKAQQIVAASRLAAEKIQADVEKTVESVAKKAGAGVILNASVVVYANDDTNNITDCLVKALNKSVQPVAYPNPEQIQITQRTGEKTGLGE